MDKPFVRSPYNYRRDTRESALVCLDPTRTKQEFAEEVDINTILRRFNITGQLPEGVRMPTYGDFEAVYDFQSAANAIALAHEAFDALPAEVRFRFQNDPQRFVEFCSDPENLPEARKLGLAPAEVAVEKAPASSASSGEPAPAVPAAPAASSSTSSGTVST